MKVSYEVETHEEFATRRGDDLTDGGGVVKSPAPPFTIHVLDREGEPVAGDSPCTQEAHGIEFDVHINDRVEPTKEDMELYRELAKIEHALKETYEKAMAKDEAVAEARYRPHFIRLFYLARLVLEGDITIVGDERIVGKRLSPEVSKVEIAALASDVIEDEAPGIKNAHLNQLASMAVKLAAPFMVLYVLLLAVGKNPGSWEWGALEALRIDPATAANFMLLWVGCFVGVCLSYAIRTHEFTLADLTRADADYLAPWTRLLLSGTIAMLLAMMAVVQLGDIAVGSLKVSDVAGNAMVAFVGGAVMGISEQKLTGTVGKRVSDLFGGAGKYRGTGRGSGRPTLPAGCVRLNWRSHPGVR